jgi:chemotaxis protein MotB
MTAMMTLFLVLWLITQSSDVKAAIAGYFQDPLGRASDFGSSVIPGEGAQAASVRPIAQPEILEVRKDKLILVGERIKRRLEQTLEFEELKDHIKIEITPEGLRITLLEDSSGVFFELGSAKLRPHAADLMRLIGSELADVPNPVAVEGHTDAKPYPVGAAYSNWELSSDRANTARRLLEEGGLGAARIVEVRGFADRMPLPGVDPRAPENRRVSITVKFDSDSTPNAVSAIHPGGERR